MLNLSHSARARHLAIATAALLTAALQAPLAPHAAAAPADYAFEAVAADIKSSPTAELAVRLVHKPSGKLVAGAVIFRSRLDMSPDNMAEHTMPVEALPGQAGADVYKFKGEVSMAGRWALKLMAKVPGEAETVEGSVVFSAKD